MRRSVHRAAPGGSLGCLGCHTPHEGEGEEGPAGSAGEPEGTHGHAEPPRGPSTLRATCASCHPLAAAEFRLPFRHPLGRGGIACTSCHPPHGLPPHELREQLRFRSCVGCHTEKKGPFVFHHSGNRNLLCLSCHEAHGSANRRLLTHATDRMLCFSCHGFIEIFHIQAPGSIYRECITCHTEIHGSNWNRDYLR